MSFNLENNPNKVMEEINNLIEEKLEKLKKVQKDAATKMKKELSSSIEKILKEKSNEKTVENVFNFSPEAIVEAHPFLTLANAKEVKLFHDELDKTIKKLGLSDPVAESICIDQHLSYNKFGFTLCITVVLKSPNGNKKIAVRKAIYVKGNSYFKDCLELILPNVLEQVHSVGVLQFQKVKLDKYMAGFILKHQSKAEKIYLNNRGANTTFIILSSYNFHQFCEKINNLSILEDVYPHHLLNDQDMIKIVKAPRLVLTRYYDCVQPTWPEKLTDETLKALDDGSTIRLNFDISHCYNDFTIAQIEKLIQRCVEEKVVNLIWELGILSSEQKSAAVLLAQKINENPMHPYRVSMIESCPCYACSHTDGVYNFMFTVGKRDSSEGDGEIQVRFLVQKTR